MLNNIPLVVIRKSIDIVIVNIMQLLGCLIIDMLRIVTKNSRVFKISVVSI